MNKRSVKQNFVIGLMFLLVTSSAHAVPIDVNFSRVTGNNTENLSTQLLVSVYDSADANSAFSLGLGAGQFLFTVANNVGIASNIAEFYLDDSLGLFSFSSVSNSLGGFTDFSGPGANPANLPGGNTIGFNATAGLSVDVNPGPPSRGVDTNLDVLGIIYNSTFSLNDIMNALTLQDLVVGMHIRSIGTQGGSDSYASMQPPMAVPEPSALLLIGLGLCLVTLARRRQA